MVPRPGDFGSVNMQKHMIDFIDVNQIFLGLIRTARSLIEQFEHIMRQLSSSSNEYRENSLEELHQRIMAAFGKITDFYNTHLREDEAP